MSRKNVPALPVVALALAIGPSAACEHLLPGAREPAEPVRSIHDPEYKREQAGKVPQLPQWQDQDGVHPEYAFWNLISRCDKHDVQYRATVEQGGEAPFQLDERTLPAFPRGYTFYDKKTVKAPIRELHGKGQVTLWIRRAYDHGMKQPAEWQEALVLEPGTASALEITRDCKRIVPRDSAPLHGCYRWVYSGACGQPRPFSIGPAPDARCEPGSYSVEGDMSKLCEYETDAGTCKVRYAGLEETCRRR